MLAQRKVLPNLLERLRIRWCRMMHDSPMWPIRGQYRCRSCGRSFLVPWVSEPVAEPVQIWMRPEPHIVRRAA
jgi:hypothetical protein